MFYQVVSAVNSNELMATGIHTKVLDENVCYRALSSELIATSEGFDVLRIRLQNYPYQDDAGVEMRKLAKRWKRRRARQTRRVRPPTAAR